MTALKEFDRLEAMGLWRASPDDQRREVVVSLGDATLTMSDVNGKALAHWSLGAVQRANGSKIPAIYHPDGDDSETLELAEDECEMINGIDRLLQAIDRKRPKPGKLRLVLGSLSALAIGAAAVLWLPKALADYTVTVVPQVKRQEIGQALLADMVRVTGQPCALPEALPPLENLRARLLPEGTALVVVPDSTRTSAHLPGGIIVLNRSVVEDHEDPDVVAGYVLAEYRAAQLDDPLAGLIDHAGLMASLQLLTTGQMPEAALDAYAETLMAQPAQLPDPALLIEDFARAELRSTPFAYALDITGEETLPLIEGDPRAGQASTQILSDGDWLRLQAICGG